MDGLVICIITGMFSIGGLYMGYRLNRKPVNIKLTKRRFDLYKRMYFNIVSFKGVENMKQEIRYIYSRIKTNEEDYLLIDHKTRGYILKLGSNSKSSVESWNIDNYYEKSKKIRSAIKDEFLSIRKDLGYPVNSEKHIIALIAYVVFTISISLLFYVFLFKLITVQNFIILICIIGVSGFISILYSNYLYYY